jgi:hypothetical protein
VRPAHGDAGAIGPSTGIVASGVEVASGTDASPPCAPLLAFEAAAVDASGPVALDGVGPVEPLPLPCPEMLVDADSSREFCGMTPTAPEQAETAGAVEHVQAKSAARRQEQVDIGATVPDGPCPASVSVTSPQARSGLGKHADRGRLGVADAADASE